MAILGQIFILMSVSLALITVVGMIKPSFVMQQYRQRVIFLFFVPAMFLMLIGRSLVS